MIHQRVLSAFSQRRRAAHRGGIRLHTDAEYKDSGLLKEVPFHFPASESRRDYEFGGISFKTIQRIKQGMKTSVLPTQGTFCGLVFRVFFLGRLPRCELLSHDGNLSQLHNRLVVQRQLKTAKVDFVSR